VTLSDVSIKNPVFAWMLMAALILFGIIGFSRLGISQMPDVDFPSININVNLEGASPEIMESDVADVLEDVVTSVQGVQEVRSTCRHGSASINVDLDIDTDVDVALQEIQTKVLQAQGRLPREIDPPSISKFNPEDQPILWLAVSSDKPLKDLMVYVNDTLKDQFQTLPGVGEVFLGGYVDRNLRIWLDEKKLSARGLTADDVIATVEREHIEVPAGRLELPQQELNVRVLGEAPSAAAFAEIPISSRGGAPVHRVIRLKEVAEIEDGLNDIRRISRFNGVPAVGLGIRKQRGANAVQIADSVMERMEEVRPNLPEGYKINVSFDSTKFIKNSIHELERTLLISALLTGLVCWFFLGSWTSTINIFLAIPTSIFGTLLVLNFCGFTLNTFTLLALSLSIGVVVDDAIMVLENIVRHREAGEGKQEGALRGARQITFAATATTLSIVAIFIPVVFMKGIMGKFFFQFGVAISVAVLLSLLEALTLTPMRCSQFLEVGDHNKDSFFAKVNRSYSALSQSYGRLLGWCLRFDVARIMALLKAPIPFPGRLLTTYAGLTTTGFQRDLGEADRTFKEWIAKPFLLALLFHLLLTIASLTIPSTGSQGVLFKVPVYFQTGLLLLLLASLLPAAGNIRALAAIRRSVVIHSLFDNRWRIIVGSLLVFSASLFALPFLKKEMVPQQDQSVFMVRLKTPVGSSIEKTDELVKQCEAYLKTRGEVLRFYAAVGGFGGGEVNTAIIFVTLKEPKDRPVVEEKITSGWGPKAVTKSLKGRLEQHDVQDVVRAGMSRISKDLSVFVQDLSMRGLSRGGRQFGVEFTIQGSDWDKLAAYSEQIKKRLVDSGKVVDADTDYDLGQPEVQIVPNREAATLRAVSVSAIGDTLGALMAGKRAGKFTEGGHRYDVRVRLKLEQRLSLKDVEGLFVRNNRGELVRLSDVVKLDQRSSLQSIRRINRIRAITLQGNPAKGIGQQEALTEAQRIGREVLPDGYRMELSGAAAGMKESFESLIFALLLGIVVAYMILGSQFNSFIHPITVLLALPFSFSGAILALLFCDKVLGVAGSTFNMYSFIGLILLMGLVKKNSILLVDFTNQIRAASPKTAVTDALLQACPIRLRPILMTTTATIAAAIPIAMALGAGAEVLRPMAIAVIGGMIFSTVLTLVVVPCAYSLFSGLERIPPHSLGIEGPAATVRRATTRKP